MHASPVHDWTYRLTACGFGLLLLMSLLAF